MIMIYKYWQQLGKHLIVKTALSHLLLGAIAVGFGFAEQSPLSIQTLQPSVTGQVEIIAFATLVQDQQAVLKKILITPNYQTFSIPSYDYVALNNKMRLSSHNGIRAGPVSLV